MIEVDLELLPDQIFCLGEGGKVILLHSIGMFLCRIVIRPRDVVDPCEEEDKDA